MQGHPLARVVLLAAVSAGAATAAELPTAAALRAQVQPFLIKPLPTVESIVGIPMPSAAPMVVVASLGDDGGVAGADRGYAVGRTLNDVLFGAHAELDVETPTLYPVDTGDREVVTGVARDSRANAYRVARREIGQFCVHGRVTGSMSSLVDVMVDRCREVSAVQHRRFEIASEGDWPAALETICRFVVDSTQVPQPDRAARACGRARSMRASSFMAYAAYATGGMQASALEALVASDPAFAPAVVELLDRMPYDGDWRAFTNRRIKLVAGVGATPAAVRTALSRHLAIYGWKLAPDIYEPMFAFIRAYPRHRSGWLLLASRLSDGAGHDHKPWYAWKHSFYPNEATHSAALALSLAYYANWPDTYRARWQLGYALSKYAWMVRGTTVWQYVPKHGRKAFPALMAMAEPLIAEALAAHPYAAALWEHRITTLYHVNGDWRGAFDAATEHVPRAQRVYEAAMEYSSAHWGGRAVDVEHVEAMARKHNPTADWVRTLRARHDWNESDEPETKR